jgi:hypothetical protein
MRSPAATEKALASVKGMPLCGPSSVRAVA